MKIGHIVALIIVTFISSIVIFEICLAYGIEDVFFKKLYNGLFSLSICETGVMFGMILVKFKNTGLKILFGILAAIFVNVGVVLFYLSVFWRLKG
ncbi:MAG: hypothetical protein IJM23_02420 [Lachnospiraceae bacterium]|nr:hypothetical protein [Lachnospiraceae bacterium]